MGWGRQNLGATKRLPLVAARPRGQGVISGASRGRTRRSSSVVLASSSRWVEVDFTNISALEGAADVESNSELHLGRVSVVPAPAAAPVLQEERSAHEHISVAMASGG